MDRQKEIEDILVSSGFDYSDGLASKDRVMSIAASGGERDIKLALLSTLLDIRDVLGFAYSDPDGTGLSSLGNIASSLSEIRDHKELD